MSPLILNFEWRLIFFRANAPTCPQPYHEISDTEYEFGLTDDAKIAKQARALYESIT